MRTTLSCLALALTLGTPALAQTEYPDVASLLEAVRSGKQKLNRQVSVRAVVTTPPVALDSDGIEPYTTWFYVNDAGRDGDGVLFSLPNYYAGTNPFDEEDDNPWENEISIPALKRGYVVTVSGRIESRSDESGGYAIKRYEFDHVEQTPDDPAEETGSGSLSAELPIHSTDELPAAPAPSEVSVVESSVRQGELVVVSGKNLGDRARLLLDGRRLEMSERRPGVLIARIPSDATPGKRRLTVQNPLSGTSPAVEITVLAPTPPPPPELERATRLGKLLLLRGANLSGKKVEVQVAGKPALLLSSGSRQILCELPAAPNGNSKVKVTVDGVESNELKLSSPAAAGFTSAIPGQ